MADEPSSPSNIPFIFFFSRDSSALICWSSTYLLGTSGAHMYRGLPTVHFRFSFKVAVVGFEPPISSLQGKCFTTRPSCPLNVAESGLGLFRVYFNHPLFGYKTYMYIHMT